MMIKRGIIVALLATLVGMATACNDPVSPMKGKIEVDQTQLMNVSNELDEKIDSGSDLNVDEEASNVSEKIPPSQENKQEVIKVFYTDPEQIEVKQATRTITFKSDWGKYKSAFKALQHSDSQELIPLWSNEISLNKLEVTNGNITIDLHIPPTANLGSSGEQFAITALKETFFQFEEVKSLELLVDGKQQESLMGHVELEHPMTRNEDGEL